MKDQLSEFTAPSDRSATRSRSSLKGPPLEALTLPTAKAGGFLVHRESPPVGGLMAAPQAFNVSVRPTATGITGTAEFRTVLGFHDDSNGRITQLSYIPSPKRTGLYAPFW
jgi:hypothetical protein